MESAYVTGIDAEDITLTRCEGDRDMKIHDGSVKSRVCTLKYLLKVDELEVRLTNTKISDRPVQADRLNSALKELPRYPTAKSVWPRKQIAVG